MGTLRLPRRRARPAAKPTPIFIFDSAISKLLVGNSNQRRGGGARWRGSGCPRAAVVMAHYATRRPARFASRFLALCDFCHACPLYHCSGGREVPSWDGLQLHQLSVGA
jgi:hypothetical protein